MIVSFRKWWIRAKFVAVFVILTVLLYELLRFVGGWIEPAQRYKEPTGKAVKAFRHGDAAREPETIAERLLFFYRYGE
ncbi:DUF4227 family protein [Paenibacillus flagellatus]|uniref:DUF4227 domain-containing protein n=1 Tax=Paenibacillus flagellatus TaxID=2211139 RepID=A0A2V5KYI5_9BACL|nr:DUF4227 family protein [Paenibacillus flagellatus]PYI55016.1 DUF4227 domain-containing protein [Paenibacillus flagellatus]